MTETKVDYRQINGIAFRAYRVASYNSGTNSQTSGFNFDTENYDYGNNYDTSTGLFTAPINGIYQFVVAFYTEGVSTARAFPIPRGTAVTSGSGVNTGTRGLDYNLAAGNATDRVQSVVECNMTAGQTFGWDVWTTASGNLAAPDTWFAGHLVMAV